MAYRLTATSSSVPPRSAWDWFLFHGGFHISPGLTVYNGNHVRAQAFVPGGSTFTLDDVTYTSVAADPVNGTASLSFGRRIAPSLTVGFGNMIPRNGRRWSIPVEIGVQYIGDPRIDIVLHGTACKLTDCVPIGTDPEAQTDLGNELIELNNDVAPLRFYPIFSVGYAYRF